MGERCNRTQGIQGHPCFGGDRRQNGRIHLPVAPRCNIKCRYCNRRHDCVNESRPGVTSRVLTPAEALARVQEVMASPLLGKVISVVGIAGPGDPLANEETFATFRLVREEFPYLSGCLSTNGLLLPEKVDELAELGVRNITVTVNALDPMVGGRIYRHVDYQGRHYRGVDAATLLIASQLEGIRRVAGCGMAVKVNTVLIPGVNDGEMRLIARTASDLGASIMNVIPLIPREEFADWTPPDAAYLEEVRHGCGDIIGQLRHCRQCRADAVGLIGGDVSGCRERSVNNENTVACEDNGRGAGGVISQVYGLEGP